MSPEDSDHKRTIWIAAFAAYVIELCPGAPKDRVAGVAANLYARLGEHHPIEVAEAEWGYMGLGE